jgi:hypothetical protein
MGRKEEEKGLPVLLQTSETGEDWRLLTKVTHCLYTRLCMGFNRPPDEFGRSSVSSDDVYPECPGKDDLDALARCGPFELPVLETPN